MLLVSYVVAPYRPRLTLAELPAFRGYLGWLSAAQILSAINWQCDRLVLGKLVNRPELGQFSVASELAALPVQALAFPLQTPLFSALSTLKKEPERLRTSLLASIAGLTAICWPVMMGFAVLAEPFVKLVLGPQWLSAVVLIQVLTLSYALTLSAYPVGALALALGRTRLIFRRSAIRLAITLPAVLLGGYTHGLMGVACAHVGADMILTAINLLLARRLVDVPVRRQLAACTRPLVAVTIMAAAVLAVRPELAGLQEPVGLALGLAAVVAIGGCVYVAATLSLWAVLGRSPGLESEVVKFVTNGLRRRRPAMAG